MHRFNMGNDNPVRNNKLLREAYQAGRRQALNEVSGGDAGGGGDPFGGGGGTRPAIEVDNSPIIDLDALGWIEAARAGQNVPNWVIEWFAQNAPFLSERLKQAMFMGRRSVNMGGLREQAMPPSMQSAPINYNTSATKFPGGGNRMGMGMMGKGRGMGMNLRGRGMGMGTPDERALVLRNRDLFPADLDQWDDWVEHGDGNDDVYTPFGRERKNKKKGQHFVPTGFQYRPIMNHERFPEDIVYNSDDGQWYFIPTVPPYGSFRWDAESGRWVKGSPYQG